MVIVSSNALARDDGEAILNNLKQLAIGTPVVDSDNNWNGLNILHNEASAAGACDLGIQQYSGKSMEDAKIVYLLGEDDFRPEDIPEDAFVIYQGAVGDEGAYFADLILPGTAYTEKQGTYVNLEGRPQFTRAAVTAPQLAKQDWMIIRAISEELGVTLPYDNMDQLRD